MNNLPQDLQWNIALILLENIKFESNEIFESK